MSARDWERAVLEKFLERIPATGEAADYIQALSTAAIDSRTPPSAYPLRNDTIDVLVEVARKAAIASTCEHPEDIASAMTYALEHAAVTVQIIHKRASA